jgi:hypothetical protein
MMPKGAGGDYCLKNIQTQGNQQFLLPILFDVIVYLTWSYKKYRHF